MKRKKPTRTVKTSRKPEERKTDQDRLIDGGYDRDSYQINNYMHGNK